MQKEFDHEARMFHALELESRYNTELFLFSSRGVEKIASFCLKQLTNYGRSLWRPFVWLLIFWFVFFGLYIVLGGVNCVSTTAFPIQGWREDFCEIGYTEISYAFKNTFVPFGFVISDSKLIIPNNGFVKALGYIHMLLSSVIWFIWILQIRRRFKL